MMRKSKAILGIAALAGALLAFAGAPQAQTATNMAARKGLGPTIN